VDARVKRASDEGPEDVPRSLLHINGESAFSDWRILRADEYVIQAQRHRSLLNYFRRSYRVNTHQHRADTVR
jgi:hypothetical protein